MPCSLGDEPTPLLPVVDVTAVDCDFELSARFLALGTIPHVLLTGGTVARPRGAIEDGVWLQHGIQLRLTLQVSLLTLRLNQFRTF
jgi:hypothetical protein